MSVNFKRGDFVKCEYEGKEYVGNITETPKKGFAKVKICLSSKRADKPIWEVIDVSLDELSQLIEKEN